MVPARTPVEANRLELRHLRLHDPTLALRLGVLLAFALAPLFVTSFQLTDLLLKIALFGTLTASYDVVIGYVETHGRKETDALTEGLPVIPRRPVEYRGVTLTEMDLDAVLERKPQLALVDEFAHTNAPGSRHPKRYQDVEELLAGAELHVLDRNRIANRGHRDHGEIVQHCGVPVPKRDPREPLFRVLRLKRMREK